MQKLVDHALRICYNYCIGQQGEHEMDIVTVEMKEVVTVDWPRLALTIANKIAYDLKNVMFETCQEPLEVTESLGTLAMYAGDAKDGFSVCKFLSTGDWDEAINMIWSMDTEARSIMLRYLDECGGKKFRKHFLK
jgi:hypothetical protein